MTRPQSLVRHVCAVVDRTLVSDSGEIEYVGTQINPKIVEGQRDPDHVDVGTHDVARFDEPLSPP